MKKVIIIIMSLMLLTAGGCSSGNVQNPDDDGALLEGHVGEDDGTSYGKYRIWPVEYPEGYFSPDADNYTEAAYTDFEKAQEAFRQRDKDADSNKAFNRQLKKFYITMMESLLSGEGNNVFSPVNLYFNFTMLSSIVQGRSRDELIGLLGVDYDTLVKNYRKIWMDNTLKGTSIVSFANSIWLNEGYSLKKNTIQKIATEFFAPVFEGNPGTAEFEKAFKDWLNDNTGNMLQQQVNDIPFDGGIVMALASTIYYKSSYLQNYVKNTEPTVFHGHKGDDEVLMMSKSLTTQYLYGSLFSGYIDQLGNEEMLMILPDENVTFSQLLEDPAFLGIAFEGKKDSVIEARVNATVPAFDVTSKFDLKDILMSMGITGIFGDDPTAFTPVTDDSLFVDFMEHACRFKSDESGVEAAAYTVETMKVTSAHPQGPVYTLVFDRPFIFIIRSKLDNTILFCGVINNA